MSRNKLSPRSFREPWRATRKNVASTDTRQLENRSKLSAQQHETTKAADPTQERSSPGCPPPPSQILHTCLHQSRHETVLQDGGLQRYFAIDTAPPRVIIFTSTSPPPPLECDDVYLNKQPCLFLSTEEQHPSNNLVSASVVFSLMFLKILARRKLL